MKLNLERAILCLWSRDKQALFHSSRCQRSCYLLHSELHSDNNNLVSYTVEVEWLLKKLVNSNEQQKKGQRVGIGAGGGVYRFKHKSGIGSVNVVGCLFRVAASVLDAPVTLST